MIDEMILVPRYELLAWAEEWLYENDPGDGTDCVTPFDTYLLKTPVEAPRCTCPSGDGSLRWPCPAHPPEAQPVGSVVWSAGIENTMIEVKWSGGIEPPVGTKLYAHPPPSAPVGVGALEVFRIAGGDTECEPNPTPERALEVLRDLRACYDEALTQQPAAVDEVEQLTEQQAVIVTGYTGTLCGSFGAFHADLEKRAGRPVFTHEMSDFGWIKSLYRDDFIALAGQHGGPHDDR